MYNGPNPPKYGFRAPGTPKFQFFKTSSFSCIQIIKVIKKNINMYLWPTQSRYFQSLAIWAQCARTVWQHTYKIEGHLETLLGCILEVMLRTY